MEQRKLRKLPCRFLNMRHMRCSMQFKSLQKKGCIQCFPFLILYLSILYINMSFMHNIFSPQCNYFLFFSLSLYNMFRSQTAIIRCLVYTTTVVLYKMYKILTYLHMCKCDVSCLIYFMYTWYLFALINFTNFLMLFWLEIS
jgi:hypothetical protein